MNIDDQLLKWFTSNGSNILASVVAAAIVLGFQIISRAASLALAVLVTLRWSLRLLWRLRDPGRVYVVSGAITNVSEEVKSVILAGPDAIATSTLIATVGLLYPKAEVRHVYSSTFARDSYKDHLVVVGGPVNNTCCSDLLAHISTKCSFGENLEFVVPCLSNQTYEAAYDQEQNPIKDYGAVIRMVNPFDKSKDVLLVVGCDTFGVLAAAMLISSRPDAKEARVQLRKRLGLRKYFRRENYIAIVECDVLGNDIGCVSLKDFVRLEN